MGGLTVTAVDSVSPSDSSEDAGILVRAATADDDGADDDRTAAPGSRAATARPGTEFLPPPPGPVPKSLPPPPDPVPKFFPPPPTPPLPFANTAPLITIGPITTGQQQPDPISSPPGPVPKSFPLPPGPVGKFFPLPPLPVPKFLPLPPDTCSVIRVSPRTTAAYRDPHRAIADLDIELDRHRFPPWLFAIPLPDATLTNC